MLPELLFAGTSLGVDAAGVVPCDPDGLDAVFCVDPVPAPDDWLVEVGPKGECFMFLSRSEIDDANSTFDCFFTQSQIIGTQGPQVRSCGKVVS